MANLNETDPAYGPNCQACMDGPNGAPSGCVCKPSACLQPCFGVQYTSPKDGSRGCCPLGQTFSYDPRALCSHTIPSPELEDVVLVLLIPNLLVLVPQLSLRARNLSPVVLVLEERTLSGILIEVREPSASAHFSFC